MKPVLHLKTTLLCLTAALAAGAVCAAEQSAYDTATADGYFWYRDKPAPKKSRPPEQKAPSKVVSAQTAPAAKESEMFSAAWIRAKQQELLDLAITNPSYQNVRAYQYLNRLMLDKSDEFARMTQKVIDSDPMLSESVRVPISALARQQALWQIDQAKEGIIKDLSSKAGIWMFFDSSCNFCHSQFQVSRELAKKYGMEVRYVSTDGGVINGMNRKDIRFDKGARRAQALGIKVTPATVLMVPPDRAAIIAHGAMSLSELEQKIVTAAIDMNLADPNLSNLAKLNERGMINNRDLQQAQGRLKNPDDMNEVVKLLNEIIGKNM